MRDKLKKVALQLAKIIVLYVIGSTIILGLTFVDWAWVLKYPREALLVLNIPLVLVGSALGMWGEH